MIAASRLFVSILQLEWPRLLSLPPCWGSWGHSLFLGNGSCGTCRGFRLLNGAVECSEDFDVRMRIVIVDDVASSRFGEKSVKFASLNADDRMSRNGRASPDRAKAFSVAARHVGAIELNRAVVSDLRPPIWQRNQVSGLLENFNRTHAFPRSSACLGVVAWEGVICSWPFALKG